MLSVTTLAALTALTWAPCPGEPRSGTRDRALSRGPCPGRSGDRPGQRHAVPDRPDAHGQEGPGGLTSAARQADPALEARLQAIDSHVADIKDVTAAFEERKFTALLKEPLRSTGRVRIKGSRSRWDTLEPHRTTMTVDLAEIRIYYPSRGTLEVYELGDKLNWLAVSPLPRLATLQERFVFEPLSATTIDQRFAGAAYIGLRLRPKDEGLQKYLDHVDVVLDEASAFVVHTEMTDPDGERTVLTFNDVRADTGLSDQDVALTVPQGTQIVRPLEGTRQDRQGGP